MSGLLDCGLRISDFRLKGARAAFNCEISDSTMIRNYEPAIQMGRRINNAKGK